MTSEAPRAFNREMYHDHPENVFYGTDDGCSGRIFRRVRRSSKPTTKVWPRSRRENIHMISVVGGLYGLNLIPLWRPKRITIFDINPDRNHLLSHHPPRVHDESGRRALSRPAHRRGLRGRDRARTIRAREHPSEARGMSAPRTRFTKRPYEQSWQYAFENFDLTKQLLSEVPLDIRTEPMESESFSEWIREPEQPLDLCFEHHAIPLFRSGVRGSHQRGRAANHPSRAAAAPGSGAAWRRAVKVKFEIPLRAERIGLNRIFRSSTRLPVQ